MEDFECYSYCIDKPVTNVQPLYGANASRIITTHRCFDILVGFPDPTTEEIESIYGSIAISLFVNMGVPFLVLHTDKFTVDLNFNIKCINEQHVGEWLNDNYDGVHILFVDSNTMKLVALRIIELSMMREIRQILKSNLSYSYEYIDNVIAQTMNQYSIVDMWNSSVKRDGFLPIDKKV